MADVKITSLAVLTAADPINDAIPIVDVSDTTMAASGTTKRISVNNILGASGTATLASATITGATTVGTTLGVTGVSTLASAVVTGALTVDTTTLVVDASNDRVGIGTATPAAKLIVRDGSNRNLLVSSDASQLGSAGMAIGSFTDNAAGYAPLSIIAGTSIGFGINGITGLTLNSTANLVLKGGTAGATGVGVTFPATQVASSDANCLDDYEEGTWTPVFQGTTSNGTYVYSTQVGRYTKVGNLVTVFGHLVISSITLAATGVMRIGGLPFTTSSVNVYSAATVGWTDLITISSGTLALSVNTNGVVIDMYRILSGAGVGFITPSDLVVNTRINFTATYFV